MVYALNNPIKTRKQPVQTISKREEDILFNRLERDLGKIGDTYDRKLEPKLTKLANGLKEMEDPKPRKKQKIFTDDDLDKLLNSIKETKRQSDL